MKKTLSILSSILLFAVISTGCKKGEESTKEVALDKKYAKYKVAVYKDKELKTWLATLEKAEDVSLLDEEKAIDKKSKDVSKVRLADDSIGYVDSRHLADSPIVFVANTKTFLRPTSGSTVFAEIPKGELGFIIGEKGLWVQVYVGEINNKNITQQWVEGGYSNDPKLILEAKEYAAAVKTLNDKDEEKAQAAKSALENLANGHSVIADMAKEKLGIQVPKEPENTETPEINDEEVSD